jgi:hypothetical protein
MNKLYRASANIVPQRFNPNNPFYTNTLNPFIHTADTPHIDTADTSHIDLSQSNHDLHLIQPNLDTTTFDNNDQISLPIDIDH